MLEHGTPLDLTRVNHLLAVLSRKKQLLEQVIILRRCGVKVVRISPVHFQARCGTRWHYPSFRPIHCIRAVMFIWRLTGSIFTTVPCCIVYDSCAHWYVHTHMWAVLTVVFIGSVLGFFWHFLPRFLFLLFFSVAIFIVLIVYDCVFTVPAKWLAGKNVSKITYFSCQVG